MNIMNNNTNSYEQYELLIIFNNCHSYSSKYVYLQNYDFSMQTKIRFGISDLGYGGMYYFRSKSEGCTRYMSAPFFIVFTYLSI